MDFALGEFDVMRLLGKQVTEIRETNKWRKRYSAGVVDAINDIRQTANEYYEEETEEIVSDYWEQQRMGYQGTQEEFVEFETQSAHNWINNDFLSYLSEQLDDAFEPITHHFLEGQGQPSEEFEDNLGFTNLANKFRNFA
jgi:hypothetical protein